MKGLMVLGAGLLLASCASRAPAPGPAGGSARTTVPAAAVPAPRAIDPGSDWRMLPTAAFGGLLQELHQSVHEVLLFDGQSERECFALDKPERRFAGRDVQSYLYCYGRGRLERIEVTIMLPPEDAEAEFSRDCDAWQVGTAAITPRTAEHCDGEQPKGLSFSAGLGQAAEDTPVLLTINVAEVADKVGP